MSPAFRFCFVCLCLILPAAVSAQSPDGLADDAPLAEVVAVEEETADGPDDLLVADRALTYTDGLILGLVEGITEYLPVSSTGHLILTNELLGLDLEQPLADKEGQPILYDVDPVTQEAMPFTLKDAADAYVIIIQGGAILAVVILYWGRIWGMVEGLVFLALTPLGKFNPALERRLRGNTRAREGMLLARNLISAFLPAAIFGLLLDDWIEDKLFDVLPVITALVAGSFLMFAVERMRKRKTTFRDLDVGPDLHELNIRQCVIVGLLQCVAMWPGTSRSMMTIVGGYVVGLNPVRAAEFSFLLGFITLSAASGYKALTVGQPMLEALDLGPVLFGIAVATISAALAVRWLVAYLTRHGLALFAWYRIALAVAVIFLWEA